MPFCHLSSDRQVAGGGARRGSGVPPSAAGRNRCQVRAGGSVGCTRAPRPPPDKPQLCGAVPRSPVPAALARGLSARTALPLSYHILRSGLSARRRSSIITDQQHFGDPVSLAARVPPTSAARAGWAGSSALGVTRQSSPSGHSKAASSGLQLRGESEGDF